MLLNIATVAVCVIITMAFRRLDRTNSRIIKLRRFTDRTFSDFKKMSDEEKCKFNDATIEMDLMLKKASGLAGGIRTSIDELEKKLTNLNTEKAGLKKVEENLQIVSNAALDVNRQIKYIDSAKASFGDIIKKIQGLSDSISRIEKDNVEMVNSFNERIKQKNREIGDEINNHLLRMRETIAAREEKLLDESNVRIALAGQNFAETVSAMEHNVTATGDAILENVKSRVESITRNIGALETRVESSEKRLLVDLAGKITTLESRVSGFAEMLKQEKDEIFQETRSDVTWLTDQTNALKNTLANMESTVFADIRKSTDALKTEIGASVQSFRETRNNLVTETENELHRLYDSIDEIKGRIEESRQSLFDKADREAERMMLKLKALETTIDTSRENMTNTFDEQLARMREAMSDLSLHSIAKKDEIIKAVRREAEEIRSFIDSFNEKYHDFERKITSVTDANMQRLQAMKDDLVSYEQTNRIWEKTEDLRRDVENAVGGFQSTLESCHKGAAELREFMQNADEFREISRTVEKELKLYQNKKDKMETITAEIHAVIDLAEEVKSRADALREGGMKIDVMSGKIESLQQSYSALDNRIAELSEHESLITNALHSLEKMNVITNSIDARLGTYQAAVDKTEKKVNKMTEYLASIEKNTLILKSKENEIRGVQDKFMEIESLSDHLEERTKQLIAMLQKIEKMHDQIDETDTRLKDMYDQTDRKMRQFSDFIQSMGSNGPITKQMKKDIQLDRNINDSVIKTVRELSTKGWSADEISGKLMIDENTVRLIINTATM